MEAFDRVKHAQLFGMLIERTIRALALKALLDMYQRQNVTTVWVGKFSRLFESSNGVRQCGVVSPVLFYSVSFWIKYLYYY